ncbi:conserved hypothetical protein [Microsporum canis CBS 113480]|uniref:Uncharacterized protein n=1 Tax=Arthroderma otae (strain ATCC MYA-4605 / CBS 113480) TaxID=554155 RepID=C5FQY2_ARTOC|nr:conserved hypothetical protein [Microsporum canis CBS 113480]EEQ32285.1 conserved hypothetical protein [Microsporum canis CBS 113480]
MVQGGLLQFQLALALAIVQSKPPDMSIREYALKLRDYIIVGKRAPETTFMETHLDSTAFWREAYEKSEAAQSELLDKIYELEQRNEARLLRDKWDKSFDPTSPEQSRASAKSKCLPANRPKKRAKTMSIQDNTVQESPTNGNRQSTESPLQQTSKVLDRMYPTILQGLTRTTSIRDAKDSAGLIVYHLTKLFQQIIQQSYQYALLKADPVSYEQVSTKPGQKSKAKPTRQKKTGSIKPPPKIENIIACFAYMTSIIFKPLDPEKHEHSDLLEGLTFVILEHVGKVLGILTFKDLSLYAEPTTNNLRYALPVCLTENHSDSRTPVPEIAEVAAVWNSKYLIPLLKQAMLYMDKRQKTVELSTSSANVVLPSSLLTSARVRLQSTLLRGVFGADDPSIGAALNFPPEITSNTSCLESSIDPQACPGEWFTQEVWALLGWDSLLKCECLAQREE